MAEFNIDPFDARMSRGHEAIAHGARVAFSAHAFMVSVAELIGDEPLHRATDSFWRTPDLSKAVSGTHRFECSGVRALDLRDIHPGAVIVPHLVEINFDLTPPQPAVNYHCENTDPEGDISVVSVSCINPRDVVGASWQAFIGGYDRHGNQTPGSLVVPAEGTGHKEAEDVLRYVSNGIQESFVDATFLRVDHEV